MKDSTKNKKPWYGRWYAIVLYVFIGIIVLSAIFGTSNQGQTEDTSTNSIPKENGIPTYSLNQEFEYGDFAYTIHGVETKSQVGDSVFGTEKADGVFLIVDLTIENIGKEPEYFQDNVYITDSEGREFEEDSDAKIYYGYDNLFSGLDKLQPNLPKRAKLIFDVPTDLEGKIGIKKSMWSSDFGVYVSW